MRSILCLLLACLLTACVHDKPNSLDCDQIAALRAQMGKETTAEQLRDWVIRTYQLPSEAIAIEAATAENAKLGTVSVVRWQIGDLQYVAQLGDKATRLLVVGGAHAPTDSWISCLGESAWYVTDSDRTPGGVQRTIDLFFFDQGIGLHGWYYVPVQAESRPPVNGDRLSWNLVFMKPAPVEQLVNDYYGMDPAVTRDILQRIRPWPGDWAEIVFPRSLP
jgi:hypothetical protein